MHLTRTPITALIVVTCSLLLSPMPLAQGLGPDCRLPAAGSPECEINADCSDLNTCTADECVDSMCVHTPFYDGATCEADGNPCTEDRCFDGYCYIYAGVCFDDFNECTDTFCSPLEGVCNDIPNTAQCDDDDPCTIGDQCGDGYCTGTSPGACDPLLPEGCPPVDNDCNDNGEPDSCDIAEGTSLDCNINQVPDACDLVDGISSDCNENGTPDECDVDTNDSDDCNGNIVPDECELNSDSDCNANDTLDFCELVQGLESDCNGNAVPDSCDIARRGSEDCNGNSTPDECELNPALSAPLLITGPGGPLSNDGRPHITTDGAGTWVTVWHSTRPYADGGVVGYDWDIFFSRSTDAGLSWSAPSVLNSNAFDLAPYSSRHDGSPRIATDGQGLWLAVWNSSDDFNGQYGSDLDIFCSRSLDGGVTWSDPAPVNNAASDGSGTFSNDQHPRLAADLAGNWVAVWQTRSNTNGQERDLFYVRSDDNGQTWSTPQTLNSNASTDDGAEDLRVGVTTDQQGTWIAAWHSFDDFAGTIGSDADILYSRSTDNGITWTPAAPLNNSAFSDSGDDTFVHIATDGAGWWIALWQSDEDLDGALGSDLDILLAISTDGGASWSNPEPLHGSATDDGIDDQAPTLTVDGSGHWVAAWQRAHDLFFARSVDHGTNWTIETPLHPGAAVDGGDESAVQLATDGLGNWVATWEVEGGDHGDDEDVLAVRFHLAGSVDPDVCPCLIDLDDDGGIGAADLAILLGSWGPCPDCPADFDGDGGVNAFDLAVLLGAWGLCP